VVALRLLTAKPDALEPGQVLSLGFCLVVEFFWTNRSLRDSSAHAGGNILHGSVRYVS